MHRARRAVAAAANQHESIDSGERDPERPGLFIFGGPYRQTALFVQIPLAQSVSKSHSLLARRRADPAVASGGLTIRCHATILVSTAFAARPAAVDIRLVAVERAVKTRGADRPERAVAGLAWRQTRARSSGRGARARCPGRADPPPGSSRAPYASPCRPGRHRPATRTFDAPAASPRANRRCRRARPRRSRPCESTRDVSVVTAPTVGNELDLHRDQLDQRRIRVDEHRQPQHRGAGRA